MARKWTVCLVWDEMDGQEFSEKNARSMAQWLTENLKGEAWEHIKIQLREGPYLDSVISLKIKPTEEK